MSQRLPGLARVAGAFVLLALLVSCAPTVTPSSSRGAPAETGAAPRRERTKTITIGITSGVQAMGVMGSTTTAGGWMTMNEIHSNGLVTADVNTRKPIGRLVESVPSLDDGSI